MDFYDIRELEDCYNIDTNFLINSMEKQLKRASACSMSIIQDNNLLKIHASAACHLILMVNSMNTIVCFTVYNQPVRDDSCHPAK